MTDKALNNTTTDQVTTDPGKEKAIEDARRKREEKLAKFGSEYGFILYQGQAKIVRRRFDHNVCFWRTEFAAIAAIEQRYINDSVPSINKDGDISKQPIFRAWYRSEKHRINYDQLTFSPVKGMVSNDGKLPLPYKGTYNLYSGLAVQPSKGDCTKILDHIRIVWCGGNEAEFEYILNWLARMYQIPGERGHTVPVLKSGAGTGKNIVIDMLVATFGEHGVTLSSTEAVTGRFNNHLAISICVHLCEAIWGGNRSGEGALKTLVTDPTLSLERKYVDRYQSPNNTHLIISSNNDWCAPMDMDDRRFFVMTVSDERKGDVDYFKVLAREIESGGKEAFVDYLLKRDISGFNPRVMPKTMSKTKLENKLNTAGSFVQWWYACLKTGELAGWRDHYRDWDSLSPPYTDNWEGCGENGWWVEGTMVAECYSAWTKKWNLRPEPISAITHRKFRAMVGLGFDGRVKPRKSEIKEDSSENRKPWGKRFPDLTECRTQFEKYSRQEIDWEVGEDAM